jgi:hypothetical protein
MTRLRIPIPAAYALILALVTACTTHPVREAQTPELKAQALYADYVLAEESAARIMQNPQVPDTIKVELQKAHKEATPVVEELERQRIALSKLRMEGSADLPGAILTLNELITQAAPLVTALTEKASR